MSSVEQATISKLNTLAARVAALEKIETGHTLGDLYGSFQGLPGLRGAWLMSSTDENGNVYDASGQGRTLTNNGGCVFDVFEGLVPYANMDGTDDYFSRADEAGLDITGALTIGVWVRKFGGSSASLMGKGGIAGQYGYRFFTDSAEPKFSISSDGTALTDVYANVNIPTGAWSHVVARYTPSVEMSIFINGAKINTNTTAIPAAIFSNTGPLQIGRDFGSIIFSYDDFAPCYLCAAAHSDILIAETFNTQRGFFGV